MAFKFVVFAAVLAYANAGLLGAPAVAAYSAAPAVSTAYINSAPLALSAPVVSSYAASPLAIHTPAIGATHSNIIRTGLGGAVSQYSKAVDTAFSSVRKFDTRVSNPTLAVAHAAPVLSTYAAHSPVVSTYAAHAPVVSTLAAHAPAALAYSPAAVTSHVTFSGLGASYGW